MHFPTFDFTVNVPTIIAGGGVLLGIGKKLASKVNSLMDAVESIPTTQNAVALLEARIASLEKLIGTK